MFREGLDVVGCGLAIRERVSLGKVRTGWKGFERHCVRFVKVRIFFKEVGLFNQVCDSFIEAGRGWITNASVWKMLDEVI